MTTIKIVSICCNPAQGAKARIIIVPFAETMGVADILVNKCTGLNRVRPIGLYEPTMLKGCWLCFEQESCKNKVGQISIL
jgi:hypothetical protein